MNKVSHYLRSFQKPNFLFIFITILYFLNNSIFSLNENVSIYIYFIIFLILGTIDYKFLTFQFFFSKKIFLLFLLLISPSFLFIMFRSEVGISFRGDEIAHYSNSLTNLSYWFSPQNNNGLKNFLIQSNISILDIINIKIINLIILIFTNLYSYLYLKKFFNLILFITSLIVIFFQNSFPYEYAQGSFFIDNITQIFFYIFLTFSFNETLGVTNFIFYIIYLLILRPIINNEKLSINDFKLFGAILVLPHFNLLLFSNYQEGIAVIFVLLAIENFYKFEDFKKSSLLLSIAGCFREIFFLPIIIFFIFDTFKKKKDFIKNIKFYSIIFSPFIFHILHISKNVYGSDKINFITFNNDITINSIDLNILNLFRLSIVLLSVVISIYLFYKNKNIKFIILLLLNTPIIILLLYRNHLSFLEIDRFFYLWVLIFYFYIFIFISNKKYNIFIVIVFSILLIFNNFNFLKKYINYEINFDKRADLYLPIKSILKKEKKENVELYIINNINMNRFNPNLFPNLTSVNFNESFNSSKKCVCKINNIYLFINKSSLYEQNLCSIKKNSCKKKNLFNNKLHHIVTLKK